MRRQPSTAQPAGPRTWWPPTLLVALVAIPVAALVLGHAWDGLYGQDAFAYQAYTMDIRAALLDAKAPAPFTWPPGFPALAAVVSLATGPSTLAAQLVSLAAGILAALATWLSARVLLPDRRSWVPLVAGAAVAVAPQLWQSSAVVMADTLGLAAFTLGAWAFARWARSDGDRWAVLAAVGVATAIATRWAYLVPAVPVAVAGAVLLWRGTASQDRRRAVVVGAGAVIAALVVLLPVVGPMAWAALRGEPVPAALTLTSHTWDLANLLRSDVSTADGPMHHSLPMAVFYGLEPGRPYHLGPVLGVLALVGLARVLRRGGLAAVTLLVAWPACVLVALAGDGYQNTRFALAALPPVAMLAADGAGAVARRLEDRGVLAARPSRTLVAIALVAIMGTQLAGAWHVTDDFIRRFQADRAAIAALAGRVPTADRLVTYGATLTLRHAGRMVVELSDLTPAQAAAMAAVSEPLWLLAPADASTAAWRSVPVWPSLAALLGPAARVEAMTGGWGLWRVDTPD